MYTPLFIDEQPIDDQLQAFNKKNEGNMALINRMEKAAQILKDGRLSIAEDGGLQPNLSYNSLSRYYIHKGLAKVGDWVVYHIDNQDVPDTIKNPNAWKFGCDCPDYQLGNSPSVKEGGQPYCKHIMALALYNWIDIRQSNAITNKFTGNPVHDTAVSDAAYKNSSYNKQRQAMWKLAKDKNYSYTPHPDDGISVPEGY